MLRRAVFNARVLFAVVGALAHTTIILWVLGLPAGADDTKVDIDLQRLTERAAKPAGKVDQLRQEILVFRQAHPGSPAAVAAAGLLRDLPSALDKFDPKNIAPLEKFSWQPPELVAVLGEHRGRQGGAVTAVAYSRNGKILVSGSNNGYVRFWDPATMRLQVRFIQPGGNHALAFSKDSALLAGAGGNGSVVLWDVSVEPPTQKDVFKVASAPILAVAIAPNGKSLAAAGTDTRVALWDLSEGAPREASVGDTHTAIVHALAYSPDGKTLATGSTDKTIRLWSISKDNRLKEKAVIEGHAGGVLTLAFHPTDDKLLVSGGGDGVIRFWNVTGGKLAPKSFFKSAGGNVYALAFSQSGKTLVSGHGDGTCRTWVIADGKEKSLLEGHSNLASAVAFSPDGSTIVTGSHDWTVRQWPAVNAPKPRDKTFQTGHLGHVYAMSFAPDGQILASSGVDRSIRLWDMAAPQAKERLPNIKTDTVQLGVSFAPDGKSLAGWGGGISFRTYDTATRRFIYTFQGHTAQLTALAYSPDGSMIATSGHDKSVRLWNPKTGKGSDVFNAYEAPVYSVAFSGDSKYVLTAGGAQVVDKNGQGILKDGGPIYKDSNVRLYDLDSKSEIFRWKDEKIYPNSVSFAPGGSQFVVGASDALLRTWSWPEPQPTDPTILYRGAQAMNHHAFSPDGRYLAIFAEGGYALLDRATGKKLRHWIAPENFGHVAFAPDSRHLTIALGTGVIFLLRLKEAGKK